jgi:nitrogen regulatory protein PII-like uncharacterized protein
VGYSLIDSKGRRQKESREFDDIIERIEKVLDIVQDAENQEVFIDGQEPTMVNSEQTIKIESEIDNKISDEQNASNCRID